MGLLTGLATLPLAPVRGVIWIAEVLTEQAEAQLYDPGRIAAEMQEIADQLAAGEIDEDEAAAREEELLARLPRTGPATQPADDPAADPSTGASTGAAVQAQVMDGTDDPGADPAAGHGGQGPGGPEAGGGPRDDPSGG